MSFEVVMPKMGESIVEGTIIEWKKKVGDKILKDETLLEISTDKVDSEIPSPHEGTVIEILFAQNDTVSVGEVIAIIGQEGEKVDKKEVIKKTEHKETVENNTGDEVNEAADNIIEKKSNANQIRSNTFFSPLVKSIAKKENISLEDLEHLEGSGVNGRFTKNDILQYIDESSKQISSQLYNKEQKIISTLLNN